MWIAIRAKSYPTLYPKFLNLFIKTLTYVANWPTILVLTLFRMGFFGAAHKWGGGGKKAPPALKPVTHACNYETWHSYISSKEDPKNIWITWHTPWVLLTSAFFHRKSVNFAILRNTDKDCTLIHNFYLFLLFWVFIDCYNFELRVIT